MKQFLLTLILFAQLGGQPAAVPIQNPSFEQLPIQDSAYQLPNAVMTTTKCYDQFLARSGYPNEMPPGWVRTYRNPTWGQTAIIRPFTPNPCGIPAPPDGSWILYVASSTVAQDTGVKLSALQQPGIGGITGRYAATFWVANYDTVYPGYYEVAIIAGTIDPVTQTIKGHELCSADGWATQHFAQVTFPCMSPDYLLGYWPDEHPESADPEAHIIISLSHTKGWPLLFDDVSLKFQEQP